MKRRVKIKTVQVYKPLKAYDGLSNDSTADL